MGQPKRKDSKTNADAPASPSGADASDVARPHAPGSRLTRTGWILLGLVVLAVQAPLIHYFVFRGQQSPTATLPYADDFSNPATLAENYFSTGGLWRIENGELKSPGVRNNPLWLKAALPQNVVVEFDVRSESPEGDIKVELFGDGLDHSSGYVFIHGGWNNSMSIISRLDEHGAALQKLTAEAQKRQQQQGLPSANLVETGVFKKDTRMRVEANPFRVERGRMYHWRIERRGGLISWSIDGAPFMQLDDPFPLAGKWNDRFGFSSWDATLIFDNLKITAQ